MEKKNETLIEQMAGLMLTGDMSKGFSDYKKAKALDALFKVIKQAKKGSTNDDILADAANQIRSFLDEDAKAAGYDSIGEKKAGAIAKFIELFRQLCDENYGGNVRATYRNRNHLRSAYLWYVSANIGKLAAAKKEREKNTSAKDSNAKQK
nr:hypothetical protein [Candidatus Sigynarchaeota archaeon]